MQTILVTGANGQLGNELKQLEKLFPLFNFIFTDVAELDITNAGEVDRFFAQHQPAYVINCAAYTAVDKAESEFEKAQLINCTAVENLTKAAQKVNAVFVHTSTDYVFDGKQYRPYVETDATNPESAYGRTKLDGEVKALLYNRTIIIRTAWLYSTFGANFVKTMLKLGSERDELGVVFDQIGSPTYAADLALAILTILKSITKNEKPFVGGIYHYTNEGVCSWYDFATAIMRLGGKTCKVNAIESKQYPTPAPRPHYSVLNKQKIKETYGVTIPHWFDGLTRCIEKL